MRSLLTMLGIIIGVVSVLLSISIAQGIKHQTSDELNRLGSNFITVRPGQLGTRDNLGRLQQLDISSVLSANGAISTLTEKDSVDISELEQVSETSPVMLLNGSITNGEKSLSNGLILATNSTLPSILNKEVSSGAFFGSYEMDKPFVVLGNDVANELFGVDAPLGSKIKLRGNDFTVVGIMKKEQNSTLSIGPNLDNAVYIPVASGKQLSGGDARFQFIYAKAEAQYGAESAAQAIGEKLKINHTGETDYTIIKQDEAIGFSNGLSRVITTGMTLIMSLSLFVGGIGVMNSMLMLVTERTREIGIRKALGATNRQIAYQFFIESIVLSTVGGMVGLLISVATITAVVAYTDFYLALTWQMVAAALGVSIGIGVIFGVLPAIRAARKDPITALRM